VDAGDLRIRNLTYELFVQLGRAPTSEEASVAAGGNVRESWRRLHDAHALVLDGGGEIRMANPFSAVPTPYRVEARGRRWFGNCAWDAFGICAALHTDGRIETSCRDCGEELLVDVRDERPSEEGLLFHCLVPAAHWWDDIVYT
jgi:Alkylmercury lyase